jgi:hypothetical protein
MKCYVCKEKLVWGGDHVFDEEESKNEEYDIVTNLSCNNCNACNEKVVQERLKEIRDVHL